MFLLILLKQLNSLTTIDMFSGLEVTHRTLVRGIRGQFLAVALILFAFFVLLLLLCFYVFV